MGWFADAVDHAAERTVVVLYSVGELVARWTEASSNLRRDAAARRLVPRLAEQPVVNAAIVAELLEVSEQTGRVAISELANLGVLTEFTSQTMTPTRPGRPRQWWVASELLALLGR